jgi:hypothetical protein
MIFSHSGMTFTIAEKFILDQKEHRKTKKLHEISREMREISKVTVFKQFNKNCR